MPAVPIDTDQIIITASRAPDDASRSAASATMLDQVRIVRLGEPLAPALLRLAPSTAITAQGPSGLFTEVRIRGAENNHTLLFIDGIRANDPATGDFARFELLNADLASRIEVVRGPQSALWGSQAIGGVIAINGLDEPAGAMAIAEAGSFGSRRLGASGSMGAERASLSGAIGWQRASGIDSFSGDGDRDGYRNMSGRLRGTITLSSAVTVGASALALTGTSEFDGYDLVTFERADTLDTSKNRLAAARVWAALGQVDTQWRGRVGATLLGSSNDNRRDGNPVNRTKGTRRALDAQVERQFVTGRLEHQLIAAFDAESETFEARDTIYLGATNQDRDRSHKAITAEWKGDVGAFTADVAIRRDMFNRFKDATSLRASLLTQVGGGFALAGSYAQGIAQPTFFDLFGFFPGDFVGNPDLKPESSRGFEGSVRFRRDRIAASLSVYRQHLRDEIVDNANFTSVENSESASRRWGVEAELGWQPVDALRVTAHYAYLKSTQPDRLTNQQLEEWRRPRHSGSLAADGGIGCWSYGASIAYVGSHLDRQEVAPFAIVRLDSYVLANARIAYAVTPGAELFVRGSNLLDSDYEDSAGYRTEGRGLFVGIRLADRRSSP
ncbi:TonB-dependent receptor [Sphingomonas lutea]|uniref:TonB-dependent receptor n=1 Tax=Sphingomonas lutea TaxID=1045317 RepID=A0A7G9SFN6_9SPHN|nr:TonB-dependent receptor [Sphingomonas lutea]QNN66661.1 TonB-dependent receptor [Sphingomonas lutea]